MNHVIELMKNILKKNKRILAFLMILYKYKRKNKSILKTVIYGIKGIFLVYIPSLKQSRGEQIKKLFYKVKIKEGNTEFVYNLDAFKLLYTEGYAIENTTIDYQIPLEKSLEEMKQENDNREKNDYQKSQQHLLIGIEALLEKEIKAVKNGRKKNKQEILNYLENIKNKKAQGFAEALQRILFYNQLLWQTGHPLNGLGRLDKILYPYYEREMKGGKINKEKAEKLIDEFLKTLHENYWLKSNSLLGDTGQIIILGGKEQNGDYFCNDLTYLFIKEIKKLQIPDPKILLRVANNIPRDLMEISIDCIKTGIGCPLFSNDEVIVPKLIDFGYSIEDSYNYVTAACWEPLVAGKSFDQNNMKTIVFIEPFNKMLNEEDLEKLTDLTKLMQTYKNYLQAYINEIFEELETRTLEKDPLISLFIPNCNKKGIDISDGGAVYNNYGATSVSLANTVNSIMNINQLVWKDKKYTLYELNQARKDNFEKEEKILETLKKQKLRYGKEDEQVIQIANEITKWVNEILEKRKNHLGGKLKFGLSAPSYIDAAKNIEASLDGRKAEEPFIVHISSDIPANPYTELIQFASKLDYTGNRFNGNVVDFMITPSFMENNLEKFTDFLILSIEVGFFQMQMNVVSSETLIKAKENPEAFPNLIVRVWGFSAYFNDLPEEYKNVLIERALKNESKSY